MSKISTLFNVIISLIMMALPSTFALGQTQPINPFNFDVEVVLPETAQSLAKFGVELIVKKDPKYTGSLKLNQTLPLGFDAFMPKNSSAKLISNGREITISVESLPAKNSFSLKYEIQLGLLQSAAFPFCGTLFFEGVEKPFSSIINVEGSINQAAPIWPKLSGALVTATIKKPDLVKAGASFKFVTTLHKSLDYNKSGSLRQKYAPGFEPVKVAIAGCNFDIENNEVVVSWEAMASGQTITISYLVKVGFIPSGVYPVLTLYSDESGFKFSENTSVTIENLTEKKFQNPEEPESSNYKISLEYPDEVLPDERFAVKIMVQKGKTTLPGSVELNLPPGFEVENQKGMIFTYDQSSGKMNINWPSMPANPEFETILTVKSSKIKNAIFAVTARLFVDGMPEGYYSGKIYVAEQKAPKQAIKTTVENAIVPVNIDTTAIFAKIDNLLNEWKAATNVPAKESAAKPIIAENVNPPKENPQIEKPIKNEIAADLTTEIIQPAEKLINDSSYFAVQIAASTNKITNLNDFLQMMGIYEPLNESQIDGSYIYTVGEFVNLKDAANYLTFLKSKGYADAFVVEFLNGQRVKVH